MIKIYTLRMAKWLKHKGFNPIGFEPNSADKYRIIYLFEDSDELEEAIKLYLMTDALD